MQHPEDSEAFVGYIYRHATHAWHRKGRKLTKSAETSASRSEASQASSAACPLGGASLRARVSPGGTSLMGTLLPRASLHSSVRGGRCSPSIRSLPAAAALPSPCHTAKQAECAPIEALSCDVDDTMSVNPKRCLCKTCCRGCCKRRASNPASFRKINRFAACHMRYHFLDLFCCMCDLTAKH